MLQAEEPTSSPDERCREISQLIQGLLSEDHLGTAYRRHLLTVLDQWGEPDTDVPTINTLPQLTCEASGGDPFLARPVTAAWQLVRLAAKLFDDVEDGQSSGDPAQIINLATSLLFVASLALENLEARGVSLNRVYALDQALNRAMLRACAGQDADLGARRTGVTSMDPDAWLEIAQAKSGELLAWAGWAGALVAGANQQALTCYREYGCHLGVLLQVADDFNDVWNPCGDNDLAAGQPNLSVCYALSVVRGGERTRLAELLGSATQGDDVAEAHVREWLTDLGAQGYMLVVAQVQYRQALAALQRASPDRLASQQLSALLDRVLPALRYTVDQTTRDRSNENGSESQ